MGTEEKAHNARVLHLDGNTDVDRHSYLVTWGADWHLRVNWATVTEKEKGRSHNNN